MSTIRSNLKPEWFTPPSEEGEAEPIELLIQPLKTLDYFEVGNYSELRMAANIADSAIMFTRKSILAVIRLCIADWRNVKDGDGNPVTFSKEACEDLRPGVLKDAAFEVMVRANMTDDEKKSLPSPLE